MTNFTYAKKVINKMGENNKLESLELLTCARWLYCDFERVG